MASSFLNKKYTFITFIQNMVDNQENVGEMRKLLHDFLTLLQMDTDERCKFTNSHSPMMTFMTIMYEPGIDDFNMSIIHTILVYLCEEEVRGDRKGLRNIVKCTFEVDKWHEYNTVIDHVLDQQDCEAFQQTCRLYFLFTFVNEIRQNELPADFYTFVSVRATQILRGISIFPDQLTIEYALECLNGMANHFEASRETMIGHNAPLVLFKLLQQHLESPKIVELCLKILNPMTPAMLEKNADMYPGPNGVHSIVLSSISKYIHNSELVGVGCRILYRAITKRPQDIDEVMSRNAWGLLTIVQETHMYKAEIESSVQKLQYELKRSQKIDSNQVSSSRNPNMSRRDRVRAKADRQHSKHHAKSSRRERSKKEAGNDAEKTSANTRETGKEEKEKKRRLRSRKMEEMKSVCRD